MPNYPAQVTYRGYFYNNKVVNGVNDREYTAMDIRRPYDALFTDGIKPEEDGTAGNVFKVTANAGMVISVGRGVAKVGGAPIYNDAPYVIELDDSVSSDRYDAVIVRNDDSDAVRGPSIYIKSLSAPPTVENLERNTEVYELCLAYIRVPAFASAITQDNIIDTREDGNLCNIMLGVGATVVRTYHNTYFSETEKQTVIPIGIEQYRKTRDRLTVIVEGLIFAEDINYTIVDDEYISLNLGLPIVGTRVDFEVIKNVNGASAETVITEVDGLLKNMAVVKKKLEHHYYCNGTTDNVEISKIAQEYINGGTDYGSMRLVVHGTFGAVLPYSGAGVNSNQYYWFALGKDGASTNRRLVVDFTDCSAINLPIEAGTYNTVFAGNDVRIIGASVVANQGATGTYIRVFSSANGVVYAEDCRFWITASLTSYISQTGTFVRCRGSVTVSGATSYCFYPTANAVLRVEGGEYYAYSSGEFSAVVYQTAANAVAILYGVNCPMVARGGYTQNYAVNATGNHVSITDTITTLPINLPNGNVRGTLAISKAGMM